jgi:hypothetical protein
MESDPNSAVGQSLSGRWEVLSVIVPAQNRADLLHKVIFSDLHPPVILSPWLTSKGSRLSALSKPGSGDRMTFCWTGRQKQGTDV